MRNDLRIAISFSLILAVLLTSSCTAQIGGRNNTIEQNRQAPVSNRVEQTPPQTTPQSTPSPQSLEEADTQDQNDDEPLADERKAIEEERAQLKAQRQAQDAEDERLRQEDSRLKQERLAQQIYVLQQQQQVEKQKYIDARTRREEEENRPSEAQQRAQSQSIYVESPLPPRVVSRNQGNISNRVMYPYESLNTEKKKGHSTRNKIIASGILAGAVLLGVRLSRKKH